MSISALAHVPNSAVKVPVWFSAPLESQHLNESQVQQLYEHYLLLERWNQKINLTTIQSDQELVERHYAESIFFGRHFPQVPSSLVDIGSGAGFPGIPLAVLMPECSVTLVESIQKKAVFL